MADWEGSLIEANAINLTDYDTVTITDTWENFIEWPWHTVASLLESPAIDYIHCTTDAYMSVFYAKDILATDGGFHCDGTIYFHSFAWELEEPDFFEQLDWSAAQVVLKDSGGIPVKVRVDQFSVIKQTALVFGEDGASLKDTGANLTLLDATELQIFKNKGGTSLHKDDAGSLVWDADQAQGLLNAGLNFSAATHVIISASAADLLAFSPADLKELAQRGIDVLDATGNAITLTKAKADAFLQSELKFHSTDTVTVQLTDAELAQLSPDDIRALRQDVGVSQFKVTDGKFTLSAAQMQSMIDVAMGFADTNTITIADTGANILALLSVWYSQLKNLHVDTLKVTDGLTLTLQQAQWLLPSATQPGLRFDPFSKVSIQASAAEIQALSTEQKIAFVQAGILVLDAEPEDTVHLTLAQVKSGGMTYALNDEVIVEASAAEIGQLSSTQPLLLAVLNNRNVDTFDVSENTLTLNTAQARIITGPDIQIGFVAEDMITVYDTGAALAALTPSQLVDMGLHGIDVLDAEDNQITLLAAQVDVLGAMRFGTDDTVTISDSGAGLAALSASTLAGFAAKGVDVLDASDNQMRLSSSQMVALGSLSLGTNDQVTVADIGGGLAAQSTATIAGFAAKGADILDITDNRASLSLGQYQALTGLQFMADDSFVVSGTNGADVATGQLTADSFKGLAGNDRLNGGVGADQLWGGAGKDVLTGGVGKDTFVFDAKLAKTNKLNKKSNLDKIADFNVKDDSVWLENKIFKKLGKGSELKPGKLNKKFFTIGDKAKDGNDYLVYNKKKGVLSYDQDGSGSKEAIEIATLKKNLKMTSKDFFII